MSPDKNPQIDRRWLEALSAPAYLLCVGKTLGPVVMARLAVELRRRLLLRMLLGAILYRVAVGGRV